MTFLSGSNTKWPISPGTILYGAGTTGLIVSGSGSSSGGPPTDADFSVTVKYAGGTCQSFNDDKSKCFAESGNLSDGTNEYEYLFVTNSAGRTLKGFSTAVESKMKDEEHAKMFHDYYGQWDYADQLVQAAFSGGNTFGSFTYGNADFSIFSLVGREQLVKKMSAYMNVFMYVLHEFEAAVGKCVASTPYSNEAAIHAWDEGVAFYSGYLSGVDGAEGGKMVYALAEKRGGDFGTEVGDVSQVNSDLADLFAKGRDHFDAAQCEAAGKTLKKVKRIIYIPLIQGALKYAYKTEATPTDEKAVAEGIAFMHAVLPRIHAADETAAAIIYYNMRTSSQGCDFAAVKAAFESTYESLGIKCEQVGGLLDGTDGFLFEPCNDCTNSKTEKFTYKSNKMTCGDLRELTRKEKNSICADVSKARKYCAKACKACVRST